MNADFAEKGDQKLMTITLKTVDNLVMIEATKPQAFYARRLVVTVEEAGQLARQLTELVRQIAINAAPEIMAVG